MTFNRCGEIFIATKKINSKTVFDYENRGTTNYNRLSTT